MNDLQILLAALFVSAAGLNAVANWLKVPYPIPLVIGGLLLGLIPGMPSITLNPDLVLLIFLPPLLYSSSFFYDLRSLRTDARVISLNAIGLTVFTAGAVGVIAHEVIDLPWAMSFALGAIVSPTDPAAATAIMRRVGAPRRMINVLEGESLINDATALVMYKVAVAAAIGETVSAGHTLLTFCGDVAGGIAIGLVVGYVIAEIRKRVTDVNTELTISLFSAYGAFIPADQLGVSGVLAVVTCGLYLGWRAPEIASMESRMQGDAMWSILTFLLNAALFILIGLQLPTIVDGLAGQVGERGGRLRGARLRCRDPAPLRLAVHDHGDHPDARPTSVSAREALELALPDRGRVVRDARGGLARRRAGASPAHGRRRALARARPDPVHHLLADPGDGGRRGADAALADPQARRAG